MTEKATRQRYMLEYKQESVRLVASGRKVCGDEVAEDLRADAGELDQGRPRLTLSSPPRRQLRVKGICVCKVRVQ